jgi:hypothetical protein
VVAKFLSDQTTTSEGTKVRAPEQMFAVAAVGVDAEGRVTLADADAAAYRAMAAIKTKPIPPNTNCHGCNTIRGCGTVNIVKGCGSKVYE